MLSSKNKAAVVAAAAIIGAGIGLFPQIKQYFATAEEPEIIDAGSKFDSQLIIEKARQAAQSAYQAPDYKIPTELKTLTYDQHRDIRFVRENGPWFRKNRPFEVQFFHLGALFDTPVMINEIVSGKVRPVKYAPSFFNYGQNRLDGAKYKDLGYAGFRLHYPLNRPDYFDELVSFLGASYFRALGQGQKYGLSARGLAIDTAVQTGEEFPMFREFWIEKPQRKAAEIKVYALLDSPSISGAYSFVIQPGLSTTMDVEATLFPRKAIHKLGIAPLTSMFLFGENNKYRFDDFRPEVHDSDGLLIWNGQKEWLWRPLDNSSHLRISSFVDDNPKGFGLLQRDRRPEHYQDFEAYYEQRPSVWVEPLEDWGKGVVQLVEIPSQQEIHDNIVAYWVPEQPIEPGKTYRFRYRLHWTGDAPVKSGLAKVTATYTGVGGVSGKAESDQRKFVIHFSAPKGFRDLKTAIEKGEMVPDIFVSEGKVPGCRLIFNPLTKAPTLYLDYRPNGKTSEMRISLKHKGKTVSEVWSYQWLP